MERIHRTDEELISELHRFKKENGRVPTASDMQSKFGYFGSWEYIKKFGTWNKALINAKLKLNKVYNKLDGTETCVYCGKKADEIPNFKSWLYHNNKRYCLKHGSIGIPDYVLGNLDINSSFGKGRAGEILVVKTLKIVNKYDCNRISCNYSFDVYHEKYGKIDVKTRLLSNTNNCWSFGFKAKKEANTYICIGLSSNRNIVEHVWIVPNEGKIRNKTAMVISNVYNSILKNSRWEVDSKPYNDMWQTMKLDNCKIMVDKSKDDYIESMKLNNIVDDTIK